MRITGRTTKRMVRGKKISSFAPYPLPPRNPPLNVDGGLAAPLRRAEHSGAMK
jgi:hypothetical protein